MGLTHQLNKILHQAENWTQSMDLAPPLYKMLVWLGEKQSCCLWRRIERIQDLPDCAELNVSPRFTQKPPWW